MPSTLVESPFLLNNKQSTLSVQEDYDEGDGILSPQKAFRLKIYSYLLLALQLISVLAITLGFFAVLVYIYSLLSNK